MSKKATTPAVKLTMKELAAQVDRLGTVRAEKRKLEGEEKDIKKILDPNLPVGTTIAGSKYEASKTVPKNRVPVNALVIKKLGIEWFTKHASIALGDLEDAVGKEDIDRMVTEVDGSPRINTDFIKG